MKINNPKLWRNIGVLLSFITGITMMTIGVNICDSDIIVLDPLSTGLVLGGIVLMLAGSGLFMDLYEYKFKNKKEKDNDN